MGSRRLPKINYGLKMDPRSISDLFFTPCKKAESEATIIKGLLGRPRQKKAVSDRSDQSSEVRRLALKLRRDAKNKRLIDVAKENKIFDDKGNPSPALVHRIAFGGYEPGSIVKQRLGIKSRCPVCGHRSIGIHRHIPAEYQPVVAFLQQRDAGSIEEVRTYGRKGKRIK
jgi:hypothetical protein